MLKIRFSFIVIALLLFNTQFIKADISNTLAAKNFLFMLPRLAWITMCDALKPRFLYYEWEIHNTLDKDITLTIKATINGFTKKIKKRIRGNSSKKITCWQPKIGKSSLSFFVDDQKAEIVKRECHEISAIVKQSQSPQKRSFTGHYKDKTFYIAPDQEGKIILVTTTGK